MPPPLFRYCGGTPSGCRRSGGGGGSGGAAAAAAALGAVLAVCSPPGATAPKSKSSDGGKSGDPAASLLKDVDKLIMKGRSHYKEAVELLDKAAELDTSNTKVFYKRAEVKELLHRFPSALEDLDKMLELKPDAKQGYQLRAKLRARIGQFTKAKQDWDVLAGIYANSKSKHEKTKKLSEAREKGALYGMLGREHDEVTQALEKDPKDRAANLRCIDVMERLVKEAKDGNFQQQLIDCAMNSRQHDVAQRELSKILAVSPQNLNAIVQKATLMKNMGATEAAMANLKKCLSLDPEYGPCMKLHKSIRKYKKHTDSIEKLVEENDWKSVIPGVEQAFVMDADPFNREQLFFWHCKSHLETRDLENGVRVCTTSIEETGETNPATWELLLMRANIHMIANDLDKAEEDLNAAGELQRNERRVMEAKQRLEKLKKMAARKDYYKILGVERTATEKEIKKAFRKLAMAHHPDKLDLEKMTDEEKEQAGDLYRDINEAHHVLSDEEKRKKYDLGEDIDINPGQGGGFNPFGGGFPFGGGGQQFHFKFG